MKKKIYFNAMNILNSLRVRYLFSNFLYIIKELTRATLNRSKNKRRSNRNFDLRSSWYHDFSWFIKSTPPILLLYNLMPFGQFTGILDEESFESSLHGQYRCYFFQMTCEQHRRLVVIPFDTSYVVVKFALESPHFISLSFFICSMLIISERAVPRPYSPLSCNFWIRVGLLKKSSKNTWQ